MLNFLTSRKKNIQRDTIPLIKNFDYLHENEYYFDSACQTLRPKQVIDAENDYYYNYNACGERVKYKWGVKVDDNVEKTRKKLLLLTGKSEKEYTVCFSLNTTYGINLVLQQLPATAFEQIFTSDIEHNSVFLPSISWSRKNAIRRKVLSRNDDGSLDFQHENFTRSIVLINTVSNIDGRKLQNADVFAKKVHQDGGLVLLDAAQAFAHDANQLKKVDFDAVFGSGHKMYGPSIGFIIIKKSLLKKLNNFLLGGGTVYDVEKDDYRLITEDHELHATLELGLQNWAGIIGLGAAIDWFATYRPQKLSPGEYENALSERLFNGLTTIPALQMINANPSPIVSFYVKNLDSHRLALYLSEQNIMCRSGYFCCHYYLKNLKKYPPLLRISLGVHNTDTQIDYFLKTLNKILQAI